MSEVCKIRKTIFAVILTISWLIDRVTKIFALEYLQAKAVYRNYGIAFDILKDSPLACFFLALSGTGLLVLSFVVYKKRFFTPGIAFLLAGALGNLADRLIYGYVVDWIHVVGHINLADIWLCVGAFLLLKYFRRNE